MQIVKDPRQRSTVDVHRDITVEHRGRRRRRILIWNPGVSNSDEGKSWWRKPKSNAEGLIKSVKPEETQE